MEKFVIQGGAPLSGEIVAAGNKNAALPILAACLLTDEEVVLTNVPRIRDTESQVALPILAACLLTDEEVVLFFFTRTRDTESQVALLEGLGVKVGWNGQNEL